MLIMNWMKWILLSGVPCSLLHFGVCRRRASIRSVPLLWTILTSLGHAAWRLCERRHDNDSGNMNPQQRLAAILSSVPPIPIPLHMHARKELWRSFVDLWCLVDVFLCRIFIGMWSSSRRTCYRFDILTPRVLVRSKLRRCHSCSVLHRQHFYLPRTHMVMKGVHFVVIISSVHYQFR
jgi:hypothetical protein